MSDTTKGVWHRKEAEPGNFAKGWDAVMWGNGDRETILPLHRNEDGSLAVREMPEAARSDEAGSQEAA